VESHKVVSIETSGRITETRLTVFALACLHKARPVLNGNLMRRVRPSNWPHTFS